MVTATKSTILSIAKRLFALHGYEGFSMRTLAKESGVGISSIYHFFNDKDQILKELFDTTNRSLGKERALLPASESASQMLYHRIEFQFKHIEDIVFVLKYYLHFRPHFLKLTSGFIPAKGYLHITEVLEVGVANGEFTIRSEAIEEEAKVITHAINGFLLEYYPNPPTGAELKRVCDSIHTFLMRSLTNKEAPMK